VKPTVIKGRVWMLTDDKGRRLDDVDTDMIYHNRYLTVTDPEDMKRYAFSNLPGWEDFPKKAVPGDILIVGRNFGAGSSRQHAVDCFIALGISAIVGESFGAIYKRNAINSGWPLLEAPGVFDTDLKTGDVVEIDLKRGEIKREGELLIRAKPFSRVQMDIYQAGDLFAYAKTSTKASPPPRSGQGRNG